MNSNMPSTTGFCSKIRRWIEQPRVQHAIIVLIVINGVILGLETDVLIMSQYGDILQGIDRIILAIFVVEIVLRIMIYGWHFFRDPWSLFDFLVISVALIPASGPFAVLRALRILRVLRILTIVPSMRRVVGALLASIPGLGSITFLLLLIYYVSAVIATNLFGTHFPQWFGTIGESVYTLFQIMTLESWSMGIVRPVMEVYPHAWIFFVLFILIATFTMLNLFIAIIVNAMETLSNDENLADVNEAGTAPNSNQTDLQEEIRALRAEVAGLKALLRDQL